MSGHIFSKSNIKKFRMSSVAVVIGAVKVECQTSFISSEPVNG